MHKMVKMYLHSNKDYTFEVAEELGLTSDAEHEFAYALYEVEFELEVDTKTGDYKILSVTEGENKLYPRGLK